MKTIYCDIRKEAFNRRDWNAYSIATCPIKLSEICEDLGDYLIEKSSQLTKTGPASNSTLIVRDLYTVYVK